MMKFALAVGLAAMAAVPAAAPAAAAPAERAEAPQAEEARIPFVNFRRIRSFHAPSDDVVYLQDVSRNWYRAQLTGPCWGLRWANAVGVDTRGSSTFDRYSAIVVDGMRCHLVSLTRSEKPERRRKKAR